METESLRHHLLIAMPQMDDPNFHHSVTYLLEHNEDGAMGITLNRAITASYADVLSDLNIEFLSPPGDTHELVAGGPVQQDAGFILHPRTDKVWKHTTPLANDIWLTTSLDILEAIAEGSGPDQSLMALGYAGWGAGQLEQEMIDNAWLSTPASPELIFNTPIDQRWHAAAANMGIDVNLITSQAGHS